MTRHIIVLLILSLVGLSACNRSKDDDVLEAISQAEKAQESMGEEEIFARDMIEQLTAIIDGSSGGDEAIDIEVERWLTQHGDALTSNAHTLQRKLESMSDPERARYEEVFNVFMRPTLDAWKSAQEALQERDAQTHARVRRALKTVMSKKPAPEPQDMPAPEDAPEVGADLE